MHTLATAILEHTTDQGVHHDWLIEDPTRPDPRHPQARLWTARVLPPPAHWAALGRFDLQILPPHRRHYLTYQGPVPGHRGRVQRIATGTVQPLLWSPTRLRLAVHIPGFTGIIDTHAQQPARHLARVVHEKVPDTFFDPDNLPQCPHTIDKDNLPTDWLADHNPGTYHDGASICLKKGTGIPLPKNGLWAGNQCCYDSCGILITTGSGAGTPDIVSVASSNGEKVNQKDIEDRGHHYYDVEPFIKLNNDWQAYHDLGWAPENGGAPENDGKNCE